MDRHPALALKILRDLVHGLLLAFLLVATSLAVVPLGHTQQPEEEVLYEEDFDDGQAQGWDLEPGWEVDANWLNGSGHAWARYTKGDWGDGRLTLDLITTGVHVNIRVSDVGRYFIGFHSNPEGRLVAYLSRQIWAEGDRGFHDFVRTVTDYEAPSMYRVEIAAYDGTIQVTVNGTLVIDEFDPDSLPPGTIAFETLEDSFAQIDYVRVIGPPPPPEAPRVDAVRPAEGRCGTEMTLAVYGANLSPGPSVSILEGVETIYTEVINPGELEVGIVIHPEAPPGLRPVQVVVPGRGATILEEGFTVTCPQSGPEGRPDWVLLELDWEIVEEDHLLVIGALVENVGDVPAPEAIVQAASQAADWAAETIVPGLDSGDSVAVLIKLEIPDGLRGRSHPFRVGVDPGDEIAEWRDDNNWQAIEVWVPGPSPEVPTPTPVLTPPPPDQVLPVLTVVVVATVTLGGITFAIRRTIKIRHRKEWQEKAKEEEPPETCQPCIRHCRKIELELEPALRKIAHLSLGVYDPVSGEQSKERQVKGKVVDGLNKAITAHRRREKPEKLQRLVAPVAGALLQQLGEWLRREPAPCDVFVVAHLAGGKATFQFILYHCRRRGNVNVWEEEDEWKATVEDERDEPVTTLCGLDPTEPGMLERVVPELTQRLMKFIEKV